MFTRWANGRPRITEIVYADRENFAIFFVDAAVRFIRPLLS